MHGSLSISQLSKVPYISYKSHGTLCITAQAQSTDITPGNDTSSGGCNFLSSNDQAMLYNSNPMSYGVQLTTRPITSVAMRSGPSASIAPSKDPINESSWTLSNMLERYSFKQTYNWPASAASHDVIAALRIPQDLIVNRITSTPFDAFVFWRGDIEVRAQVMGTPFHQGKLMMSFVPLLDPSQAVLKVENFASVMVNPTNHLFPNSNSSASMRIPFNSIQKYLDLTNTNLSELNYLGTLLIYVQNPLELAAGATDNVTISLFSQFLNNSFKVPRLSVISEAQPQSKDKVKHASSNLISKIVDTVLPSEVLDDPLSMLASFLDNPVDPRILNTKIVSNDRMNFTTGVAQIDKLTLDPSKMSVCDFHTFGTDLDEMDFSYLKRKESYLGSFYVNASDDIGKVLASFPINPIPTSIRANIANRIPLLSYLSLPFQFWRGGLTYRFEVVATSLQTAKIFAALNFNEYSVITSANPNEITSQYGQAMEINQGTNSFMLTAPYVSSTDFKYVPNRNTYDSSNSTGYINVVLLNKLVTPSNTPQRITINVYISGAEDYEVSTLTMSNNIVRANPQSSDVLPAMNIADTTIDTSTDNVLAPPSTTIENEVVLSQPTTHVQSLLKKYQLLGSMPKLGEYGEYTVHLFPLSHAFSTQNRLVVSTDPVPTDQFIMNGLFTHMSGIYRQFRGPLRFKILDNPSVIVEGTPIMAYYNPPLDGEHAYTNLLNSILFSQSIPQTQPLPTVNSPYMSNYTRLPVTVSNSATFRNLEFEVPYSSRFNSVLLQELTPPLSQPPSTRSDLGFIIYVRRKLVDSEPMLYVALGDESRLGTLTQVPYINCSLYTDDTNLTSLPPDNYSTTAADTNTLIIL